MTPTAELVKALREQAKKDSAKTFLPVEIYPEWQAAAALESTQAELAEAAERVAEARGLYDAFQKTLARAESAESSLAAANERVKELEGVLSFYASPEVYRPHPHGPAFDRRDLSDVAVAALQKAREA